MLLGNSFQHHQKRVIGNTGNAAFLHLSSCTLENHTCNIDLYANRIYFSLIWKISNAKSRKHIRNGFNMLTEKLPCLLGSVSNITLNIF